MKKIFALFLTVVSLTFCLAGCRMGSNTDTTPSTQPTMQPTQPTTPATTPTNATDPTGGMHAAKTDSARILANIWAAYADDERFAVYGGAVENSVADGPGDLDMMNTDELTSRYLLPESHLTLVQEGASLVHLMNNNIFTAAVFKLTDSQRLNTVAKDLRDNIQQNRWICGQPDKLLIADMGDGQLLMVFASTDAMEAFRTNMGKVYPDVKTLYNENILA